ncbi:hypothetical protein NUZ5A_50043 [Candidatus Nitrosotenuis uzonensis]|uniref:Uncharacterized protein n=1 Tax=Candidatus Nitrosotenuis uzonensis TaxID=1407055 RepID=A0A812F2Q9_9ARCH|nr:hypothetical protein NUZ5A_50043 [Candidatus Nitrosotenuis uzonensis]
MTRSFAGPMVQIGYDVALTRRKSRVQIPVGPPLQCLEPLKPKARLGIQSKMGQSDQLLKDKNVRRWNENLAHGSKITASVRLRRLALFCIRTNTTPSKHDFCDLDCCNCRNVHH